MNYQLLDLKGFADERGLLVSLEHPKSIPFDIKRVYYLTKLNSAPRGFHAHKDLRQVAICVRGSCRFILDDGLCREDVLLDSPTTGLIIESFIWREMDQFSDDCLLLVLASEIYDEQDYIRDYAEFKKVIHDSQTK